MKFTIGNICKEVQRIRFDLEDDRVVSAINRCNNLDKILCDIEEGTHELEIGNCVLKNKKI